MAQCEHCGKTAQVGNNVSHSKHRSKRLFHANIQNVTVMVGQQAKHVKMCTRCIKALSKVSV